jgi:putative ABC transport system permease protein
MTALFEGVSIALSALRGNKVRAALTITGVAIGVLVVMVIAAMITGVNQGVASMLEELGPRNFFVFRFFQGGVVVSDGSDEMSPWRRNPPLSPVEAQRLGTLPTIRFVAIWDETSAAVEADGQRLPSVNVQGVSSEWVEVSGGDIYPGRSYTRAEDLASARVTVVSTRLAEQLYGPLDPIGRTIRIAGVPYTILGVHTPPPDLFGGGNRPFAVVPYGTYAKHVPHWRGWLQFLISPAADVPVQDAIDDVTTVLRSMRGLKPAEDNTFAVVTQDRILDAWNQMTGVFFFVMIILSSVGLMVGGVGVVAIMMISVTERTREIGVRKALGATRREILWQFLVEAATLTLVGGAIGMALGGLVAVGVERLTPIPASVPLWSIVVALAASALTGIGFGLYPAARAARLDPVEALRYE